MDTDQGPFSVADVKPYAVPARLDELQGPDHGVVLAFPPGNLATGHAEIRKVYEQFVAAAPVLSPGRQHPALVSGDLALTAATLTTGEVAAEIARRQPNRSWLWAVDQPALVP